MSTVENPELECPCAMGAVASDDNTGDVHHELLERKPFQLGDREALVESEYDWYNETNINKFAEDVHELAKSKGWWVAPRNEGELLMLEVSELSEAMEEGRGGRDKIWYTPEGKPEGLPVELADCVIRIMDHCVARGIDLQKTMALKCRYNESRGYRHGWKKA